MRMLKYLVAVTTDGFIAHPDGSFDGFVLEGDHMAAINNRFPETIPTHWQQALGIQAENKVFDTVLMGRKTYEVGVQEGITNPYGTLAQYVFSRSLTASPDPAVTLVREDVTGTVRRLKQAPGKAIWLCGGAELAGQLLAAGLIDALVLKVHPVLFGVGIPLFGNFGGRANLALSQNQHFASGVMLNEYRIVM